MKMYTIKEVGSNHTPLFRKNTLLQAFCRRTVKSYLMFRVRAESNLLFIFSSMSCCLDLGKPFMLLVHVISFMLCYLFTVYVYGKLVIIWNTKIALIKTTTKMFTDTILAAYVHVNRKKFALHTLVNLCYCFE